MRKFFLVFLLLGLLLQTKSIAVGDFSFHFKHITNADGLSQNTVNCIFRDGYGFMWFGTGNGLCKYDGYSFTVYTKPHLPSNLIRTIVETNDKVLLIGTSAGLVRYDLKSESFLGDIDFLDCSKPKDVLSIFVDSDNNVWIGTSDDGLYCVDFSRNVVLNHFYNENSLLPDNHVNDVIQLRDGRLLIGTSKGLCLYNYQRKAIVEWPYHIDVNKSVSKLFESKDGYIWIGTFHGLTVVDPQSGKGRDFLPDPFDKNSLIHATITSIAQDIIGNIYIGTLGGLDIYQVTSNSFFHVPSNGSEVFSMNNSFVRCLLPDGFGNVWIGTEKGGVNTFNLYQKPFYFMSHNENDKNSLSVKTINSIFSNGNYLWIGTAGGGLNRYNWQTGNVNHYLFEPGNISSISNNFVTSFFEDSNNKLWVGTWGGGLNKKTEGNSFKRFSPLVHGGDAGSENPFVSSLLFDNKGHLFVGTEGGIAIMDLVNELFINFSDDDNGLASINEIGCLLMDQYNYLWIGTRKGLYRLLLDDIQFNNGKAWCDKSKIEIFTSQMDDDYKSKLPGNYVISLFEDQDGVIWIGTYGDGLVKCTRNLQGDFDFKVINRENGLCNDVIYSIEQDSKGCLWLGTDKGLSCFNPFSRQVTNYFVDDGLLSDQFYWSASYRSSNGQMFFGGVEGLVYFYPESFSTYPFESLVNITKLRVFNEIIEVGEQKYNSVILEKSLAETDSISLSYKNNVFSVEFAALDFFQPEKIRYKYMLVGVDQNWVEVSSNQRFATYSNLSGGIYDFKVVATNSDGEWNKNEKILTIKIRPPFWQSTWFRFTFLLFIMLAIFGYSNYHSRRLIVQKKKLETMVKDRTSKIEAQSVVLIKQADELTIANKTLEDSKSEIEGQKKELELKNREILHQRDQLFELNKEVQEVNQLQMKFFTNISHEFRTPLSLIIAPVENMIADNDIPNKFRKSLNVIYKNASRLNLLIQQLLDFRTIETGNSHVRITNCAIGKFVNEVFHAFDELAIQRHIDYYFDDKSEEKVVWFDVDKMENILYNLISNAFKYTPEGGQIFCSLELINNDESLLLTVNDNGIGMSEDNQSKIFDRFYRVDGSIASGSSGIGLALVKELVDLLNGAISVDSALNKGSVFKVVIPCKFDHIVDITSSDGLEQGRFVDLKEKVKMTMAVLEESSFDNFKSNDLKDLPLLLIVEDNNELLQFISNIFSQQYRIIIAANGEDGFNMAKKYSPDLVLSDVMMPVKDGITMCTQLKENLYTSHIPVILLSAKAMPENFVEGITVGADDYISKPFNNEVLIAKVKNLIESRRRLKKLYSSLGIDELKNEDHSILGIDEKFMKKIFEVVDTNYNDPLFSVETFADLMCVSRSLLYKKLKALTDLSPNDFITIHRLKKSVVLLSAGNLSINEIAYQIGFNDPKYFSRVFKKFYKKTPSEFMC